MTVLLARNRQPPPTVAAGVPHAELAAELVTLPSGLLAMVCEAIVKLKVRLGAALRLRLGCMGVCREYCVCLPDWILFRYPIWPEPAPIPAVRGPCVEARD